MSILRDRNWTAEYFEEVMIKTGRLNPGEYHAKVWSYIRQTLVHAVLAFEDKLLKAPNVFEHFAADFLLDENFHPWLIEIVLVPALKTPGVDVDPEEAKMKI
jgi:hypothetical protein